MNATTRRTPPSSGSYRLRLPASLLLRTCRRDGLSFDNRARCSSSGGPRALLNPSTVDTRGSDDGRRAMFQVLSSDWSATNGLGNQLCQSCGANRISLVISCLRGRKKKCVHLANNTNDGVPLPINRFFAMVMDAE